MFKSIQFFRLAPNWQPPAVADVLTCMNANPFVPCSPTSELSVGWIPPRGKDFTDCLEVVNGEWIATLKVETKSVPAAAVKQELDRLCKHVELTEGRKPGKKEKKDLKDAALLNLLPRVFPRSYQVKVWISPASQLLVIDSTSQSAADLVIDEIVKMMVDLDSVLQIRPIYTNMSPTAAMNLWLAQYNDEENPVSPHNFSIDRSLELKATDDSRAGVKYTNHALDIKEVAQHLKQGKAATQLAMTWDERLSFIFTDKLTLKKIELVSSILKSNEDGSDFDSDVTLATEELKAMIPDLLLALDGEKSFEDDQPINASED